MTSPTGTDSGDCTITAASTIEAFLYEIRTGMSCLDEPGAQGRLGHCDAAAMRHVATELLSWPGQTKDGADRTWLPAWTEEEVTTLTAIWQAMRPK